MAQKAREIEEIDVLAKKAKELKEKRLEQFRELRLFERCKLIALELGLTYPKSHGAWHIFKDSEMEIGYDDFAPNLYVLWRDRKVLHVHLGDLTLFKPGAWLDRVIELSNPLLEKAEYEEINKRKRFYLEEIEKWTEVG